MCYVLNGGVKTHLGARKDSFCLFTCHVHSITQKLHKLKIKYNLVIKERAKKWKLPL